jgi:phage FluMu gp28-like protein
MTPTTANLARDFARALDPTLIARDVGIEQLDDWQARLIADPPKRALICCGRQVGKSTASAICALNTAIYQAPATIVLISPSQRQSVELYRTLHEMWSKLPDRPAAQYETLSRLELDNGSRIISLPGSERTVRGIPAVDLIVIDEAARIDDELKAAVRPMMATSNGSLFALSTPAGKRGWFYEQWTNGIGWHRISIKSSECPRIDPAFLAEERNALGPLQYESEYECVFHDDGMAIFDSSMIERAMRQDVPTLFPVFDP